MSVCVLMELKKSSEARRKAGRQLPPPPPHYYQWGGGTSSIIQSPSCTIQGFRAFSGKELHLRGGALLQAASATENYQSNQKKKKIKFRSFYLLIKDLK